MNEDMMKEFDNPVHTVVDTDTVTDTDLIGDTPEKTVTRDELLALPTNFGRNDLCPCGSGKKLKRCHRQLIQSVRQFLVLQANVTRQDKSNAKRLHETVRRDTRATYPIGDVVSPADSVD